MLSVSQVLLSRLRSTAQAAQSVTGCIYEFLASCEASCSGRDDAGHDSWYHVDRSTRQYQRQPHPVAEQALGLSRQPSGSVWLSSGHGIACSESATRASRGMKTMAKSVSPTYDDDLAAISALLQTDQRDVLTPAAIVEALDRYIVGQDEAKRAVAVAMRNRWRRSRLPRLAADEIMPKNILMVGPTGVGKTEIARRLAKLADAPFIKVEATKFTELGYVGRDVDDIVKDLVEAAQSLVRERLRQRSAVATAEKIEAIILDALLGPGTHAQKNAFREMYRRGDLDEYEVTLDVPIPDSNTPHSFGVNAGAGRFFISVGKSSGSGKKSTEPQKVKICEARAFLEETESEKLSNTDQLTQEAIRAAEQDGIVFIDEIDKIVEPSSLGRSGHVSSDGVQRDLLPIIEGSVVDTKYGNVDTTHILFICSGAFHSAKPSDMLAELQGRLPIRVSLKGLTQEDFYRILTVPDVNMIRQHQALLATEDVDLVFTDAAIRTIAQLAEEANCLLDNIGARRLHTILERVVADVSFSAPELASEARKEGKSKLAYQVDEDYVRRVIMPLLAKKDLSRYVL